MRRAKVVLPMNAEFDREYGRWDIAPRVMSEDPNYHGEVGWLLSYNPTNQTYLIIWEDAENTQPEWVDLNDFSILNGVVA